MGWPKWGSSSGLLAGRLLLFHRLAEAIAFTIHLEDGTVLNQVAVGQAVQSCGRHPLAVEDLAPVAEGQIAGDQQAAAFVAVGEDLEQQLGSGAAERQVAEFIADQKIRAIQLIQKTIELIILLFLFQKIHQPGRRVELAVKNRT